MTCPMNDFLPEAYEFSHEFCLFLHDMLVETIKSGEPAGIFNVEFKLRSREHCDAIESLSAEKLWDWLPQNGYDHILEEVAFRQTCLALVSDFCHFIFEALSCSRKAKLAVTYMLLRKPFKENLFYLEWMLGNREGFLDALLKGGPEALEINSVASSPEKKQSLIRRAIQRCAKSDQLDASFIYDLRYNKIAHFGFDKLWNQAAHLVTTHKHIKTEEQNLNFVFLSGGVHESQWDFLYTRLPVLLDYAVEVIEALLATFAQTDPDWLSRMEMRRKAGLVLWHLSLGGSEGYDKLKATVENEDPTCGLCGAELPFNEAALRSIYETGDLLCATCRETRGT